MAAKALLWLWSVRNLSACDRCACCFEKRGLVHARLAHIMLQMCEGVCVSVCECVLVCVAQTT